MVVEIAVEIPFILLFLEDHEGAMSATTCGTYSAPDSHDYE